MLLFEAATIWPVLAPRAAAPQPPQLLLVCAVRRLPLGCQLEAVPLRADAAAALKAGDDKSDGSTISSLSTNTTHDAETVKITKSLDQQSGLEFGDEPMTYQQCIDGVMQHGSPEVIEEMQASANGNVVFYCAAIRKAATATFY